MDQLTCDRCGRGLLLDAPVRYIVKIEVRSAYDPLELSEEDLVDAESEMKKVVERLRTVTPDEAQDEVYRAFRFDLCATCQKAYLRSLPKEWAGGTQAPRPNGD